VISQARLEFTDHTTTRPQCRRRPMT